MEDINCENYTIAGVLHFISTKFHEYTTNLYNIIHRFDMERIRWGQEKEELLRRIASLESEKTVQSTISLIINSFLNSNYNV